MCLDFLFKKPDIPETPALAPEAAKESKAVVKSAAPTQIAASGTSTGAVKIGAKPRRKGVPGLHI